MLEHGKQTARVSDAEGSEHRYEQADASAFILGVIEDEGAIIDYLALDHEHVLAYEAEQSLNGD